MIIGACGYGSTGSSVVTDLLSEYESIQVYDSFEFVFPYRVDGLQDLEYHLITKYAKNCSSDYAIKRFLNISKAYKLPFIKKPCDGRKFYEISKEYIKKITQVSYIGVDTADMLTGNNYRDFLAFFSKKVLMPKVIEKILHRRSYIWPCRKMYFSIRPNNFYFESKQYIKTILQLMGADTNMPICLDQPFEGNNPVNSFPFFEDPYAIVVDRDPRDLYLNMKNSKHPDDKFMPTDSVQDFIEFYRKMRKERVSDKRVLNLKFEDFIYEYSRTKSKIENFLNISNHAYPKKYFNPQMSVNNTQLIRRYPNEVENIKIIEKELKEFLYPFEKYPDVSFNGLAFEGSGKNMMMIK